MTQHPLLSVGVLERRLSTGNTEPLRFVPGVNVLVGRPNTGKTRWIETLDHILGSEAAPPFEGTDDDALAQKYESASAELFIGDERLFVERRWKEPGAKAKVFVDGKPLAAADFQRLLLEKLQIPILHYPKGNPMSGQTWPELSFRTLLRHMYRRQRRWNDLADGQYEAEQHACILQFVGLAERIFTEDYGTLIQLKTKVERLRARRDQYDATLKELAGDVLTDPGLQAAISEATIRDAEGRLAAEMKALRDRRVQVLSSAREQGVPAAHRGRAEQLGERRAETIVGLEELRKRGGATHERLNEVRSYRSTLAEELDRITRAEDAGAVLADLRVTHCPACDQSVSAGSAHSSTCFLCHQVLPDELNVDGLGATRLRYERERMSGELSEANELVAILDRDAKRFADEIREFEETLRMIENELAPLRQAVASLANEELGAIDMALGELNERQRQIGRLKLAVASGSELSEQIRQIEKEIEPLEARVNEVARATDFDEAENRLAEGMNEYLAAISKLRPDIWPHTNASVSISRGSFGIRIGRGRWQTALGGTDSLYFLMAYHYGLLSLSNKDGCHYPGFTLIDMPAEFAGESIADKENFIVQPFIDLLKRNEYEGAQVIITGAAFEGLEGAAMQRLTTVHVAS
jgi:hypothetical protein